jgi:hypothetical protein
MVRLEGRGTWPSLKPAVRCSRETGAGTLFIAKITRNPRAMAMAMVMNIGVLLAQRLSTAIAACARYLIISL